MTTVEEVTLWVHIAAGFLALGAGAGAFATKKGGQRHRRFGRTFVYAMAVVSATAVALYPLRPNLLRLFLVLVAVFSFYFAFSGYRVLSRKRPDDDPARVDWAALGLLGLSGVGLVAIGVWLLVRGAGFGPVLLVFGAIALAFTVTDVRSFRGDPERGAWVGQHVVRMGAAYIATVSAFSAVNFVFLPTVARWLWPTLLGTPLLVYAVRRYERRFAPG
ncbi:MAG: DUF2306 domain-containing protein [Haloplanus sp.]